MWEAVIQQSLASPEQANACARWMDACVRVLEAGQCLIDAYERIFAQCRQPDCVYFFGEADTQYVKIGWSADPAVRLTDLQTGNPRPLRIMKKMLVPQGQGRSYEQRLHTHFARYLVPGTREWFLLSDDMILGLEVDTIFETAWASVEHGSSQLALWLLNDQGVL